MANAITRTLREEMIENTKVDIPYDSAGFKKWLIESANFSETDANNQIQNMRVADIDLWEPGDPEVFVTISKNIADAYKAKYESVRNLCIDFVFLALKTEIEYLQDMMNDVAEESKPFLASVIKTYNYYFAFMMESLNYSQDQLKELLNDEEDSQTQPEDLLPKLLKKYDAVPMEDKFKEYLIECRFSSSTRYKMLTYLRKINSLVINNGRGDSDWLQKLADRARSGINIRYARLQAYGMVHSVMNNVDDSSDITIADLQGGLTSINHYLDFLIKIVKA